MAIKPSLSPAPRFDPRLAPHALVGEELAQVEQRLATLLDSCEPLLSEIGHYLIDAGGKRARPGVTLLVFRACGGKDPHDIVDIATALELIHSASLLHDDIIDGGGVRRGKPSALERFGLSETLVAGDFLFGRAFALCGRFEERVIAWATEACISLTEGEVMQGRFRRNPAVTAEDYLEIISRKTASLFSQAARLGAYLAGASTDIVERLASCGYCVGMAFQIVDDLLDIEGDGEWAGKPVGVDLKEGNPSLPVVLAIALNAEVRRVFQNVQATNQELAAALEQIRLSGVLTEVKFRARTYSQQALASLAELQASAYADSLRYFIRQLVDRTA